MTWAQLKARISTMTDEQLSEPVIWWGDERGGTVKEVFDLDDRYYNSDEGYFPRGVVTEQEFKDSVDDEDDFIEKGQPVLCVD